MRRGRERDRKRLAASRNTISVLTGTGCTCHSGPRESFVSFTLIVKRSQRRDVIHAVSSAQTAMKTRRQQSSQGMLATGEPSSHGPWAGGALEGDSGEGQLHQKHLVLGKEPKLTNEIKPSRSAQKTRK